MLYKAESIKVGQKDMAKQTKKKPISEQLIEAIESSDLSRYRISKETGIAQSTLSEFVNGNRWLSLKNVDLVCDLLNLELNKKGVK